MKQVRIFVFDAVLLNTHELNTTLIETIHFGMVLLYTIVSIYTVIFDLIHIVEWLLNIFGTIMIKQNKFNTVLLFTIEFWNRIINSSNWIRFILIYSMCNISIINNIGYKAKTISLFGAILLNVHALSILLIAIAKLILYYHIQQQMVQSLI